MQHPFSRHRKNSVCAVAAASLAMTMGAMPILAQPDANNVPKDDKPQKEPVPVKGQAPAAQQREQKMRELMADYGVAEPAVQDAVIAYMASEAQAQRPVRIQGRKLIDALKARAADANAVPDEQMRVLVADFRMAVEADRDRITEAEAALDDKIGYSKDPRLEAVLMLLGIIGNAPAIMGYGGAGYPHGQRGPANNIAALTPKERQERREALLKQFDKDGDGKLNPTERTAANAFARTQRNAVAATPAPKAVADKPVARDAENGAPVPGEPAEVQPPAPVATTNPE